MTITLSSGRSYIELQGDGVQRQVPLPFPKLSDSHVIVLVDGALMTQGIDYEILTNGTVEFVTAPTGYILIYRSTSPDQPLVDFENGVLTEEDLDTANLQAIYLSQEAIDRAERALTLDRATGGFDAQGKRITNVGTPQDGSDAATKDWVLQQAMLPGPVGPVGPAGGPGPEGPRGFDGPQGIQGIQGPPGPAGGQGPAGQQGIQGIQGQVGPQGPQGDSFVPDVVAGNALRIAYDSRPQGFSFLATDLGALSFKNSAAPGDWSDWIPFGRGPVGPVGPPGAQGTQGVQGIQGIQGIPGPKGVNWRDTYDPLRTYLKDDIVASQQSAWIALQDTTGNAPPTLPVKSNAYWSLVASGGAPNAAALPSDPIGALTATNVQAAIGELEAKKAVLSGGNTFVGGQNIKTLVANGSARAFFQMLHAGGAYSWTMGTSASDVPYINVHDGAGTFKTSYAFQPNGTLLSDAGSYWHSGNFDPATKANVNGAAFTGDISVKRAATPNAGFVFLGNAYLGWDGSSYVMPSGANLLVGGSLVRTFANTPSVDATTVNGVGSVCWAAPTHGFGSNLDFRPGSDIAGGNLVLVAYPSDPTRADSPGIAGYFSGTWRCLGRALVTGNPAVNNWAGYPTLWVRIA
jgi:Phage T7 tail fibre protein/Collagen triple helix repeat (20 copies)